MGTMEQAYQAAVRAARTVTMDFTETVTQKRRVQTPDGMGGHTTTLNTIATHVGKRRPATDRIEEKVFADRVAPRPLYIITLPYTATVDIDDLLMVGTDTYEVLAPLDQSDAVQLRVACVEVL